MQRFRDYFQGSGVREQGSWIRGQKRRRGEVRGLPPFHKIRERMGHPMFIAWSSVRHPPWRASYRTMQP